MPRWFLDVLPRREYHASNEPARAFKNAKISYMLNYFKEVRAEMRHVSWPTRRLTVVYTAVVIAVSIITAIYLGLLDYVFTEAVKLVI